MVTSLLQENLSEAETTGERILLWGTADFGKPRTRILVDGLRGRGALAGECVYDIWRGVEDKSQLKGFARRMRLAVAYLVAYPILIWRYLRAPRHDVVFVAYMGHFDVLILWPFAKMRGAKIVWDAFLSLYDTVVEDRGLVRRDSLAARAVGAVERLACAAADVIVLDTEAHADYFRRRYELPHHKLLSVWVGAETGIFRHRAFAARAKDTFNVLFYGQFIPLHGVEFIVDAARRTKDPSIRWTIIGRGQETEKIKTLLAREPLSSVELVDWIDYRALPERIAEADLCLGVFGKSDKAGRVIPNKVFQILAVGRPLITRDGPAIREILGPEMAGVWLIEPGSGAALAEAVADAKHWRDEGGAGGSYPDLVEQISPEAVGKALTRGLFRAI